MNQPKVSVIMGIYNCELTLPRAIDSILAQTYPHVEIILCDDGSTDNTYKTAVHYASANRNIIVLKNDKNEGLAYSLNKCLGCATGSLIARQDGDDISVPNRIQKQVDYFLNNKELSIVGTGTKHFDDSGVWAQIVSPTTPTKFDFIRESPFCHGSSMMKMSALSAVNGYDSSKKSWRAEDYDLWFRMYAAGFIGGNIQESLYFVKDDRNAIRRRKFRYRFIEASIKYRGFRLLGIPYRNYIYISRPILVGLVPSFLYSYIRKKKYSNTL